VAFTGDTIFNMSIGRTDFPGGSWGQMMQSLKLLVNLLPKDTTLLTGHGDQTTMDYECQWNPYLKS
jgi:glyoxylase-like metal-dependent hydrolase (beta-lactamase superfamily II)